jgi:deoxyribodipyrimidine photo-lyase
MIMERVRWVKPGEYHSGTVVYWMNREERMRDNWALIFAQRIAKLKQTPLLVVFNLVPNFLGGGRRQWDFKVNGLIELEQSLKKKNIPFFLTMGEDGNDLVKFLKKHKAGFLVTDFSPLKISRKWVKNVAKNIQIPFAEVDAHNIVPCFVASPKQEFGAYTLRPKIHKQLLKYLDEFPLLPAHPYPYKGLAQKIDWKKLLKSSNVDESVKPVTWAEPGERAAHSRLRKLAEGGLDGYNEKRNDPNENGQSNLSPYLHYGMIAPQRVALAVRASGTPKQDREAFLEELIVRRELSDNFCFYNNNYDTPEGFPEWAKKNHEKHRHDKREFLYSLKEFEAGKTHDPLWNAAQKEMVETGKMHGYMRMYWAKKILEWTRNPEEAMKFAIHLNDKYELDGRDPNGYTGIAWSIGGVHDRAWGERPVYGKIRSMTFNGAKGKFDVKAYIAKWSGAVKLL